MAEYPRLRLLKDILEPVFSVVAIIIALIALVHTCNVDERVKLREQEELYIWVRPYQGEYSVRLFWPGCGEFSWVVQHLWQTQIINNGLEPMNIVALECVQTNPNFCSDSAFINVPELYDMNMSKIHLPISLDAGESRTILTGLRVLIASKAFDKIESDFPPGTITTARELKDAIFKHGFDYYGNFRKTTVRDGVMIAPHERDQEIFLVTFETSRGSHFSESFSLYGDSWDWRMGSM